MLRKLLESQGYAFVGRSSAVKICTWTKKSLKDKDFCYKQKFYGIESHRCCQMSPSVGFCQNKCIYCWREIDSTIGSFMRKYDDPKELIDNCILAQRKLLSGFGGDQEVNKAKLKEAKNPRHFAISLTGDPLIYPKINDLIQEVLARHKTAFVVTNGLLPGKLETLTPPTQLYISIQAPNEKLHKAIAHPIYKDAWQRQQKSLKLLKEFKGKTRTVLRLTAIKGINMVEPENYSKLIRLAEPDFVELKAYMFVGSSRMRLSMANMPLHEDIVEFSTKIAKESGYKIKDEKKESRVVLLTPG